MALQFLEFSQRQIIKSLDKKALKHLRNRIWHIRCGAMKGSTDNSITIQPSEKFAQLHPQASSVNLNKRKDEKNKLNEAQTKKPKPKCGMHRMLPLLPYYIYFKTWVLNVHNYVGVSLVAIGDGMSEGAEIIQNTQLLEAEINVLENGSDMRSCGSRSKKKRVSGSGSESGSETKPFLKITYTLVQRRLVDLFYRLVRNYEMTCLSERTYEVIRLFGRNSEVVRLSRRNSDVVRISRRSSDVVRLFGRKL
ncbi:hypothetical protein LguiB_008569 [Lonicera macranthoides]